MSQEKTLVPKLRFGDYCEAWRIFNGQSITDKITKGSSPKWQGHDYQKTGVLFITSENVRDGYIDISKPKYLSEEFYNVQQSSHLKKNDILINIVGASIGRCAPYTLDSACFTNQAVALFRVNLSHSPDFIAYAYQQGRIQKIIAGGQSDSARPNLSLTDLRNLKFHLPTLPEQKKIAAFLTSVDDRIDQLKRKKSLLQDYKKGVMQKLFSQELRFKDDDGNPYPDWEEKKLGEISIFLKGKGISKAESSNSGRTPCVMYGELYTYYDELIDHTRSFTDLPLETLVLSHANDVIIPASGETHIDIATASCVVDEGIALGGDLNIIRSEQNGVFLAYYLNNALKHRIAGLAQGSSVIHLYSKQLKDLHLQLPSYPEQTKIANFLTSLDHKIEQVTTQITETQSFKKGLLQQMFV